MKMRVSKTIKKICYCLMGIMPFCVVACSSTQDANSSSGASSAQSSDSSNDENTYYKIIWLNYDNSLLYIDNKAVEGFVPEYKGDAPVRQGNEEFSYSFSGWSPKLVPAYSNATYIAQFEEHINVYTVTWNNYDNSFLNEETYQYGSVPEYKGSTPSKPQDEEGIYEFDAWSPSLNAVTTDQTYTATFKKTYSPSSPTYNEKTGLVTYGLYPQTRVNDLLLVSSLNQLSTESIDINGWYKYENNYYTKVDGAPSSVSGSHCFFDDGTSIVNGETYWFKCEPITWSVLSNKNGYYLLSTRLLDVCRTAVDYSSSDIRTWLNGDFYNQAFALCKQYISKTIVDNSVSSTNCENDDACCGNTEDNVFLPSYKDYTNVSYGFLDSTASSASRVCKTTEYARCRGAWTSSSSATLDNGLYWTRSPASNNNIWSVYQDGSMVKKIPTRISVRPAICINMDL